MFTHSREPINRFCRHHWPHCQAPVGALNGGLASAAHNLPLVPSTPAELQNFA
jgi:hypothetical protein